MKEQPYALVTGASRGLGRAFATELARRGIHVLMTALPGENLEDFSRCLATRYGVRTDYLECDLSEMDAIARLTAWASAYPLKILINNAGLGGTSPFAATHASVINDIILVNVRATALVTHELLGTLKQHTPAWVLNVSSMASFSPVGYKTVYPASKVFIQHFSRGLTEELRGTGVFVSVVHPGPMKTNADCTLRIERQGLVGRIALVSPEVLARKALTRLFNRETVIVIGWMNRFCRLVMKTVPAAIRLPLATRVVRREIIPQTVRS